MRKPTPRAKMLAWWQSALAGERPPITHEPECGFFKRRLVKGGPWVPVAIWLEQPVDEGGQLTGDETMVCAVNGILTDPVDVWTYVAGNPISEADYNHLVSVVRWAQEHSPLDPAAQPGKPIDLMAVDPPTFRKGRK